VEVPAVPALHVDRHLGAPRSGTWPAPMPPPTLRSSGFSSRRRASRSSRPPSGTTRSGPAA
jgi:hypothetical protein